MIRLIKWVLGLCNHEWEVYQEGRVVNPRGEVVGFGRTGSAVSVERENINNIVKDSV